MNIQKKWILLVLPTIVLIIMSFRFFMGYYPLSDLFYKFYYISKNEKEHLNDIIIDNDFRFYEKGYCISKEVTSPYHLPHFLIINFESDIVPLGVETNINVNLEIFRKDVLIYSTITKNPEDLFDRDTKGKRLGINGLCLTKIPFPLTYKTYKDITIKVTILEAAEDLHKYVNTASLILFPDLTL